MAGGGIAGRLYRGDVSINFVGRQRLWYAISGVIVAISAVALLVRGLNFSLEFRGGSSFTFPAAGNITQGAISQTVTNAGGGDSSVQFISGLHQWTVQTGTLATNVRQQVAAALEHAFGIAPGNMSIQVVGPTWGGQITSKAVEALIIFLIVIVIYLSIAFEWRMAVAAFIALMHDIIITVGVYALTGFSVSPTSVIGLLTILGYSLYDTVVVFDKVRENTAPLLGTRKSTYSQAANLALNQTLVRSINTSLTALLPVAAILVVGTLLLGNGELKDLSLVLFVGMLSGTYSSIFIATPFLADLKERQPQYKQLARQVALREAGGRAAQRRAAKAGAAAVSAAGQAGTTGDTDLGGQGVSTAVSQPGSATADPGLAEADADADDLVDEEAVPAAAGQPRGASARPPGARQQPVRRPAARRRPSGKKKRR